MVLDNLNIHKNQAAQRSLKLNPRVPSAMNRMWRAW
jgi:hypothetical protein